MKRRLEITRVTKTSRPGVHERISYIGGIDELEGKVWNMSVKDAAEGIRCNKFDFFIKKDGKEVDVHLTKTLLGHTYLKTVYDYAVPESLLNLEICLEIITPHSYHKTL